MCFTFRKLYKFDDHFFFKKNGKLEEGSYQVATFHFWPKKNGKLEEGSYQVATFHLWNQRFLTQKCVNTAFLSQKWVNTAFLSRKWVNTAFLSRKWVNTAFLSRKWVNTAFFVAKFCKYALIDSFQGYPAVIDSSTSCAALALMLVSASEFNIFEAFEMLHSSTHQLTSVPSDSEIESK